MTRVARTVLQDMICMALGGRASEAHFFGSVTNGAAVGMRVCMRVLVSTFGDGVLDVVVSMLQSLSLSFSLLV